MTARFTASCGCGFAGGPYRSRPQADYALSQHSCTKWRTRAEAAARRRGREVAIDRTPKPCHHKQADHRHGTDAAYALDGCRCLPCARANAENEMWRRRQKAYGRYDRYVDAEPVRAHVRALTDAGMGLRRVVAASGVSHGALWKLMYGRRQPDGSRVPSRRVLRSTAERLLAVELDLADGARVSGKEVARRLQALVACGWPASRLARRLGVSPTNFTPLLHGTRRRVRVATARAVYEMYRELADTPPPASTPVEKGAVTRARRWAAREGWRPPLRVGGRVVAGRALPEPAVREAS